MTELLCHADASLKEFDARVVDVDPAGSGVALDRTAFCPGGGGQPCDIGTVGGVRVTRVSRKGDIIWQLLDGALPEPGAVVHGVIDWDLLHRLMRTHTAFDILCGVVWRDWKAHVIGGNTEPLRGRMDFEFETLPAELVAQIEERVNAEVAAARPILVRVLPRAEAFQIPDLIRTKINLLPEGIQAVRIVEIQGLDLQADGGTHAATTREVGRIGVAGYESKGRINKRIKLEIGG
jgi:misacylated tRNA(Ala) deacylase